MPDLSDFDLRKTEEFPEPEPRDRPGVWIAAAVLVAVAIVAAYFVYGRRSAKAPQAAAAPVTAPAAPARPLGSDADQIALPPLAETDPLVRELVRRITSHPLALAWLATNGLMRNFAVVVSNVVEGPTPARHLRTLRPSAPFAVIDRNGQTYIDPRSYERYDGIAAAAASIDPQGAAKTYATLKPRLEEAYAELGTPPPSLDGALERAIVVLLQTPVVDGPIRVEPKGIGYGFADPRLEGLTGAQKQLLRTGPRNARAIQAALRQLALALGIPAERLP